jgi:phosphatidate cytidylyltransferase
MTSIPGNLSNLTVRVLSAIVLLAGGFAALTLNLQARWLLMTLVLTLGAWELSRLAGRKLVSPYAAWLPALAVFALCLPHYPQASLPPAWTWGVAVLSLSALVGIAFARIGITVVAPWIGLNAFIIAYVGLWGGKLFELTSPLTGWAGIAPFVFTLACIAAADTGAYFAGRAFGKHKLAPELSSGKTREGAVGGLVAVLLFAAVLSAFDLAGGLKLPAALLLGAVLAAASVAGDLFISAFKRWALAKDTSNLIPGHGGVMDRFDALIFAAPFAWLGFRLLG